MDVVLFVIGILGIIYSWKKMVRMLFIKPLVIVNFEDVNFKLEIKDKGYFSIAILGGYYARNVKLANVEARIGEEKIIVKNHIVNATYRWKGKRVIDCWGFNLINSGVVNIKMQNTNTIIVKESRLHSRRMFEPVINNNELAIIIFKSDPKIVQIFSILIFVLSINALFFGMFYFVG